MPFSVYSDFERVSERVFPFCVSGVFPFEGRIWMVGTSGYCNGMVEWMGRIGGCFISDGLGMGRIG